MKHIILACAGGMSTSLLMNKMKAAAKARGVEVDIQAMSVNAFEKYKGEVDILLLGPQLGHRAGQMRQKCDPLGIKVDVVNMTDYGMMNGEKVLDTALAALES